MSPSVVTGTPYTNKKIWALPAGEYMAERNAMLQQMTQGQQISGAINFVSPTYARTEPEPLEAAPVGVEDYYDPDLLHKHLDGPGRDWCDSRRFV